MKDKKIYPFVKWAGGKRQLIPIIEKLIPKDFDCYYEPFVGGGALFFHLQAKNAVINDINVELINCYRVIRDTPESLVTQLLTHKNEKEYFYNIRSLDRQIDKVNRFKQLSDVKRASRFIYLNKTCFNGLYRVNSSGEFNTSFGKYDNPKIVDKELLYSISKYLNSNNIKIKSVAIDVLLSRITKKSFIYFDPPYLPLKSSGFVDYDKNGFCKYDYVRLKNLCDDIDKNIGAKFIISSSNNKYVLDLFSSYDIIEVNAKRSINSDGSKRGPVKEVLIKNYKE